MTTIPSIRYEPLEMDVKGRHVSEGVPRTVTIKDADIRTALSEPLRHIIQAVRESLERLDAARETKPRSGAHEIPCPCRLLPPDLRAAFSD